ncbi:MAG: hypothetical protein QOC59_530 [Microbacteriaceae bacterium]|nr:hypothetical protein [Microbacteriaceae bacterium]
MLSAILAAAVITLAPGANPCADPHLRLRCPDLVMSRPARLATYREGRRVRLLQQNSIVNVGTGPLEVHGRRTGPRRMRAVQAIYSVRGLRRLFSTHGAELEFKLIPGLGRFWKFHDAARMELWTMDGGGHRVSLRRVGPKLTYCLRDLEHRRRSRRSPGRAVYPACNRGSHTRFDRLGTSVGWADVYPATYFQNWVSVTGLRGCYALLQRADPGHHLYESREDNNVSGRSVRLPLRPRRIRGGCPVYRGGRPSTAARHTAPRPHSRYSTPGIIGVRRANM